MVPNVPKSDRNRPRIAPTLHEPNLRRTTRLGGGCTDIRRTALACFIITIVYCYSIIKMATPFQRGPTNGGEACRAALEGEKECEKTSETSESAVAHISIHHSS